MWDNILSLFSDLDDNKDLNLGNDRLKVATAALLIHATYIDGRATTDERQSLETLLKKHYNLSPEETNRLIINAEREEKDAVDLYRFTKVLKDHLDQPGRQNIVEMLWEIVLADDELHEFESNLVWRVSELLGVSTQDRIALKKKVEATRQ